MNKALWEKILKFDFDTPISEYGFSIRLAKENFWTKDFTEIAILEYKKFMYLAATADSMVSPSEIIDIVWHQHLIFTQSYQDFCNILNKQIQHIPSTHNKNEIERFRLAKERTNNLYTTFFGEQPDVIWKYNSMFDSLKVEKAKFKIRSFLIVGIFIFIISIIPFYFLLKQLYMQIDNPYFMIGYISLCITSFFGLEVYNHRRLKTIVKSFDKNSFIYNLEPLEVVYLKTQKVENIINGTVNELIENKTIVINTDKSIKIADLKNAKSKEQYHIIEFLNEYEKIFYPTAMKYLTNKPLFSNISNSMDAFQKYFNKSKKFGNLFYTNFGVLSILLLLGFTRLTLGILREKPVFQIFLTATILTIFIIFYLIRLTKLISKRTIPKLYKTEILTKEQIENNWQWSYFLYGSTVLSTAFVPLVNYVDKNDSITSSCGSPCGSFCGSSCGSSCGGCGGD